MGIVLTDKDKKINGKLVSDIQTTFPVVNSFTFTS